MSKQLNNESIEGVKYIISRYGSEGIRHLLMVRDKWLEYKSGFKCYQCGADVKWVNDFEYECPNGHKDVMLGLEAWEFEVPYWFLNILYGRTLIKILYRSRSTTRYGVPDATVNAINTVLVSKETTSPIEGGTTELPEPTMEIFSDIVGLEDVKELILNALKADKPIHILLVGPPASSKTMILEAISKYYDVPIILAGASTRAGLRDYIVENVPAIMIIDELDKVENTLDLSVLLTWMESQKLIVTMATRKAYVKCPKVCKVIAAANNTYRIPPELLSRFVVVNLKPYTEDEVREICINILKKREGVDEGLAQKVAEAVVSKLKSKDPRDCVKIARLVRTPEEVDKVVEILSKRK
jgi:Holliday junction DNA helicase RuvB